jgi:hypothetical protein
MGSPMLPATKWVRRSNVGEVVNPAKKEVRQQCPGTVTPTRQCWDTGKRCWVVASFQRTAGRSAVPRMGGRYGRDLERLQTLSVSTILGFGGGHMTWNGFLEAQTTPDRQFLLLAGCILHRSGVTESTA